MSTFVLGLRCPMWKLRPPHPSAFPFLGVCLVWEGGGAYYELAWSVLLLIFTWENLLQMQTL